MRGNGLGSAEFFQQKDRTQRKNKRSEEQLTAGESDPSCNV